MKSPVRAAEHVKYEYFILDMMIHGDTLLQFIVYLDFRTIISQLCICIFCVFIELIMFKKYYVFFKQ